MMETTPINQVKLFLFDLDGTLMTTGGAGLRALARAFRTLYNVPDGLAGVDPSGKTDPAIFREIFFSLFQKDLDNDEKTVISAAYLQFLELEMKNNQKLTVCPGVIDMLEQLASREDCLVGLGTGNLEAGACLKLAPANLNHYFPFGGFGSDSEDRAEMLKCALKKGMRFINKKIDPEFVFVIGDTWRDIVASKKAGFKSIAVATGGQRLDELLPYEPDYAFKDLSSTDAILKEILTSKQETTA